MELIFLILKILLIIVLTVIGAILFLTATILLVPIHYEVSGSIGDEWDARIKGKITYLFSIFKVLLSYDKEQSDVKLFVFGFEKKQRREEQSEEEQTFEESEVTFHEKKEQISENAVDPIKEENINYKSPDVSNNNTEYSGKTEDIKKKTKSQKKTKKFDFSFLKQQITDEHNQAVVRKIWLELITMLRHFGFRKIVTDLSFSTGDPASTGQVLGVLCMFPVLYQYNFKIIPDFESEDAYLKGTFLVAGKIRLIHVLIAILRLIFDKEVRIVFKRMMALLKE